MKILVVEPFYTESHKNWLDGLVKYSQHDIFTLTLGGFHWKWRMHGAAITLANEFLQKQLDPDLIICTDMLDVNVFISLIRKEIHNVPIALYFHENQISYPWSPNDIDTELGRDRHYGFINYASALTADHVYFNSHYHKKSFLTSLEIYLQEFPDFQNLETVKSIAQKSSVLPIGVELKKFDPYLDNLSKSQDSVPTLLWNHRWEFDKNPDIFFQTLYKFKEENIQFKLIVLGKKYPAAPSVFKEAKEKLSQEIIHWGYVDDFANYAELLCQSDILPVTSKQDFFGISVVEAMYCNCIPLLPNRLAYPEHTTSAVFYDTDEEFLAKLRKLVVAHPKYSKIDKEKIKSYQWSQQILKYDAAFSSLSANFVK